MARYEGALRRLSILFILINLLSPLSTANSLAQETSPIDPPVVQDVVPEEPVVPEQSEQPAAPPPVEQPAPPPAPVEQPQTQPQAPPETQPQSQPQTQQRQTVIQEPVAPPKGGLKIVLLDENGNLLPGGVFLMYDVNGSERWVTDGVYADGTGDLDGLRDGVILIKDILAGDVTIYQRGSGDGYTFDPNAVIYHRDDTRVIVYENVPDTRLEVRNLPIDSDLDGVADKADNCAALANGDQLDTDRDGIGDACDPTPKGDTPIEPEEPVLTALAPVEDLASFETPAVCTDSVLSAPALEIASEGITYTIDPAATDEVPYAPGQVVTITASLVDATTSEWDQAFTSEAWTLNAETNTWSRSFTFTEVECEPVDSTLTLTKTVVAVNDTPVEGEVASVFVDDMLTYQLVVTNNGDTDLTAVTITDELPGVIFDESNGIIPNLAAGTSATVTVAYTVTDADLANGSITNSASAKATGPDSAELRSAPATVTVTAGGAKLSLIKEATELIPGIKEGGEVDPNEITVKDEQIIDQPLDATGGDTESEPIGPVPGDQTSRDDVERDEEAEDGKLVREGTPDFTSALPGDTIVFTLVATNVGTVDLTNVVITDDLEGLGELECDLPAPVTLKPGESLTCTATYELTEDDIFAGAMENTANGTSDEATAEPATITVDLAPSMMLMALPSDDQPWDGRFTVHSGGNSAADGGPYADAVWVYPGAFERQGNSHTSNVQSCAINASGGSWSLQNGEYHWRNGAWSGALGAPDAPDLADAGIPDSRTPSLGWGGTMILEFIDNRLVPDGNTATGDLKILERGQAAEPTEIWISKDGANYIFVGTLSGASNAEVQEFNIDGLPGVSLGDQFTHVKLVDKNQSHYSLCSSSRNYAGADIDAVWAISSASVTLDKKADKTVVTETDRIVTYTYDITNLGNISLTNPVVSDNRITSANITCNWTQLLPGQTKSCTAIYTVSNAQYNAGSPITNTATATLTKVTGGTITTNQDSWTVNIIKTSKVPTITPKQATCQVGGAGTSTVTIGADGVGITGNVSPTSAPGGADQNFLVTLTLQTGFAWPANIAGWDVSGSTATRTYTVPGTPCYPDVTVTKTALSPITEGDTMTFTIKVENIGDVTATNVTLSDPLPAGPSLPLRPNGFAWSVSGDGTCSVTGGLSGTLNCSFGDLAPGTSKTVTVSAVTTVGDVYLDGYENTATVSATNEPQDKKSNNTSTAKVIVNPLDTGAKVTLCHATGSVSNPFVYVTVPKHQFFGNNGHDTHSNDVWEAFTYNNQVIPAQGDQQLLKDGCRINPKIEITKTGTASVAPGGTITYTITVKNAGNITISGIVVNDQLPMANTIDWKIGATSIPNGAFSRTITSLAPNATEVFTITGVVPTNGSICDQLSNTASFTYPTKTDIYNAGSGSSSPAVVTTIDCQSNLSISKTASPDLSPYSLGEKVTYAIVVTNTGNTVLTGVNVTDTTPGVTFGTCVWPTATPNQLAPNQAVTCSATHVITEADILLGSFDNTAKAISNQTPEKTDSERVTTDPVSRSLTLTKKANPTTVSTAPTTVTYTFVVKNTGNQTLNGVTITDTFTTAVTNNLVWEAAYPNGVVGTLTPNQEVTVTATLIVTQAEINADTDIVNTAIAKSGDVTSNEPEETVDIVSTSDLSITKTAKPNNSPYALGAVVTYEIVVTNTGNTTLTGVTVADNTSGVIFDIANCTWEGTAGTLLVGKKVTCSATHTITEADILAGSFKNTATADSNQTDPKTDDETVTTVSVNRSLTLVKKVNGQDEVTVSQTGNVTYTYLVTNTGNVTIDTLTIADDKIADDSTILCPVTTLAPNASTTCSVNYNVSQEQINAGTAIVNTATASGLDPKDETVTSLPDTATVKIQQNRLVDVVKTSGGIDLGANGRADAGDKIAYTIVVKNTGNTTLSAINVTDTVTGSAPGTGGGAIVVTLENGDPFTGTIAGPLAPNASVTLKASYTLTQEDINAGATIKNCAFVVDITEQTPGDNCASNPIEKKPAAKAVKSPQLVTGTDGLNAGDQIRYTIVVTNTGNVDLDDYPVSDIITGGNGTFTWTASDFTTPITFGGTVDITVAQGSVTLYGTYTITQDDLNVANGVTIRNCVYLDGSKVAADCVETPVIGTPKLSIVKTATTIPSPVTVDSVITYTFTVKNDGNVTLTNVKVSDLPTLPAGMVSWTAGDTITEIPVGQSRSITATYIVTQADINAGSVHDCATATFGTLVSAPECETVTIPRTTGIEITKTATNEPEGGFAKDGIVLYSLKVMNTGNVTLTNVTVTDDTAGVYDLVCPTAAAPNLNVIPTLQPGDANSVTCTAAYKITQGDVDAGEFTNTADVTGTPPQGMTPPTDDDSETVPTNSTPKIELHKNHGENDKLIKDQVVTYTFRVVNIGTVTLENVGVTDTGLPGLSALSCKIGDTTVTNGAATLAPGQEMLCTATYTITQPDVDRGFITNTAEAEGDYKEETVKGTDEDRLDGTRTPGVSIVKSANPNTGITAGTDVTYTYMVSNTGNVTLTNVTVTDDKIADDSTITCDGDNIIASLAPGSPAVTCSVTIEVTQAMIDAYVPSGAETTWSITNIGTASGTPPQGVTPNPVTNTDDATITGPREVSIDMVKTAARVNGVAVPGAGGLYPVTGLKANDTVTYTLVATNDGDVTLTNVTVTDPRFPALSCTIATLLPGQFLECGVVYTVTQADINAQEDIVNTATAKGTDPQGKTVTENDSETVSVIAAAPKLLLEKDVTETTYDAVGDVLHYTLVATNDGNVTLNNVTIADPLLGTLSCAPVLGSSLAPNAKMTCTGTYTIQQGDLNAGKVDNTATADSNETAPVTDSVSVPATQTPKLSLAKRVRLATSEGVGGNVLEIDEPTTVTYTFRVTNTGNVTITNLTISDQVLTDRGVPAPTCPVTTLAPNAFTICTVNAPVTQGDIDAGTDLVNTAQAHGVDPKQAPVSSNKDNARLTFDQNPDVDVTKTSAGIDLGDNGRADAGETITYTITVENTGNTTLNNIKITDVVAGSVPGSGTGDFAWTVYPASFDLATTTISSIAVDGMVTLKGTYTLTQTDIDGGATIDNCATATAGTATDKACDDDTIVRVPGMEMDKTSETVSDIGLGETVTYEFTVTNTGNTTLKAIVVNDPMLTAAGVTIPTIAELLPGKTATVSADYNVTAEDVENGYVLNCATASSGSTTSAEDCFRVNVDQSPGLDVSKTCFDPEPGSRVGDDISCEVTITNNGDVTIYEIKVTEDRDGTFTEPFPTELAPGESATRTFETVITAEDAANANLNNTVRVEGVALLEPAAPDIPVVFLNIADANETAKVRTVVTDEFFIECPFEPYVGVTLEKTADKVDSDDVAAGTVITYTFAVTNISDVALDEVIVIDPLPGLTWDAAYPDGFIGNMAVGETKVITATYTVTDADVDAGFVKNCAIADYEGKESNESCVTVTVDQNPALAIMKSARPYKVKKAGETITYTFVVTNTGGVTLHDVVIVDEMMEKAGVEIPEVGTLAPGESKTVTATYTVTKADMKLHKITNVATATDGETTSGPDTATVKVYHPKPMPAPTPAPAPTTPPSEVKSLPTTGSGSGTDASGMWMIAAATSLVFIGGGLGIRRRADR